MLEKNIIEKINNLIKNYEFVYITSDMRGFLYNKIINDYQKFFSALFCSLKNNNVTSIIPSYTYTKKGIFDVYKTESKLSLLTKWSFKEKNIIRSEHPLFSCIGIGNQKNILKKISKSAFGRDSIFDKLYNNNSCLLHLGRPLELGNTSIHYVEQIGGATYRLNKKFKTKVYNKKKYIGTDYTVFVRNLSNKDNNYISNTNKISKILKNNKLVKEFGDIKNNTNITVLDYKRSIDLMIDEFYKNQNIFINKN
tara:strand:- start:165 stop:920 length:756 start_codon:yes stop_codon:yes gene_type:complete